MDDVYDPDDEDKDNDNAVTKIREIDDPALCDNHHMMMTGDDLEQDHENTQQFLTQQFEDSQSSLQDSNLFSPPQSPINPLTIAWGRFVPQNVQQGSAIRNFDLLPRRPLQHVGLATRSRSMSLSLSLPDSNSNNNNNNNNGHAAAAVAAAAAAADNNHSNSNNSPSMSIVSPTPSSSEGTDFLGLKQIKAYDRFNEYVIGRSLKCDITASKRENAPSKQKWIHSMISNTHCRIFCMLKNIYNNHHTANIGNNAINVDMEVYIEDSSGNGTLVNNTTLLKRNERRILHTGDTICLLNPKIIQKKIRNVTHQKEILDHYSFVFINLHQTQHVNMNVHSHAGTRTRAKSGSKNHDSDDGVRDGNEDGAFVSLSTATTNNNHATSSSSNGRCRTPISSRIGGIISSTNQSGRKRGLVDVKGTRSRSIQQLSPTSPPPSPPRNSDKNNNNDNASGGAAMPPPEKRLKIDTSSSSSVPSSSRQLKYRDKKSTRQLEAEYDLRDEIGSGTCGQVRRAIHRKTGEMVAVKIIAIGNAGGRNRRAVSGGNNNSDEIIDPSIQAEAAILQSLDHPYIVKLVDVFIHPGKAVYLVMELLHGGDLFDRIVSKGRYTEVESRRVTRRMLAAVHYLHSDQDIVHRDLKPENILCVSRNDDVHVKLSDFGLAKTITDDGLKTFCGTPQYFAPEVLRRRNTIAGRGRYGKEADMWSLGVILYILLSGVPPFDGSDMDAVAAAKISFRGPRWEGISQGAKDLVSLLLQAEPRRRISVDDACSHEWIMTQDGDTHIHPLDDPVIVKKSGPRIAAASTSIAIKKNEKRCGKTTSTPETKKSASEPQSVLTSPTPTRGDWDVKDPPTPNQSANFPTPPRSERKSINASTKQEGESLLSVVKHLSQVGERLKARKEDQADKNADDSGKDFIFANSNGNNEGQPQIAKAEEVSESLAQDSASQSPKTNTRQTTLSKWFQK